MNKASSFVHDNLNENNIYSVYDIKDEGQSEKAQALCYGDLIIEDNTIYEIDRECLECMERSKKI